jgi:cyclohexanone monooxygenase/acetone monooxygenase
VTEECRTPDVDAVVIGAGVSGLYLTHLLRSRGLRVRVYEAAEEVGGVWWSHGYPGSRTDTEGFLYQYLFSPELCNGWGWSERFPAGYEVKRWLWFVADRLDLRRDIQLGTRVESARWDEDGGCWTVHTDRGEAVTTRFLACATGLLPGRAETLPGDGRFAGPVLDTSRWPEDRHHLAGRRVGILGTSAAAAQLVAQLAGTAPHSHDLAGHVTLFSPEPQLVLPMANPVFGWQERDEYRGRQPGLAALLPRTRTGWPDDEEIERLGARPREDRLGELHQEGSLALWRAALHADEDAAAAMDEFARDQMRAALPDAPLAEALVPADLHLGERRPALVAGYLEAFRCDHVDVVDLRRTPITRLHPTGLELADGTFHPLDVLAMARAHDGGAPAITLVDVRGRDDRALAQEWGGAFGPATANAPGATHSTLGLAKHGYPNLFATAAPIAPSLASANMGPVLSLQCEWIDRAIGDLLAAGLTRMEPTVAGEHAWVARQGGPEGATLDGDPGREVGAYRSRCDDEAARGYPSFART